MKLKGKLLTTGLVIGGVIGTISVVNKLTESMAGELNTVLTGEERRYPWKYGDMFYEVKGARDARPLLLIHGFGPGASSYEWRKNIDVLAQTFRVFTIDLLGFGLSDRPAIDYSAETFADLIHDFIKEVIGKPTVVVAHGMSCAYVIADAYRRPQYFERLILVSPPPVMLQEHFPGPLNVAMKTLLRMPVLGEFVYNTLTSRRAIRGYYDRQGFHNPGLITDDLVEYIFTCAHQPNSRYPAASSISNYLTMDVHEAFSRLQVPAVIVFGREGALTPSEASEAFKRVNSRVDVRILDKASQQPQDEQSAKFNALVEEFAASPVQK
ncbi:MAG TPA: alpha/beta fold hydrolase [Ktedonobacteraceae bacterium]|nr:alpha/beta fold hydrolase [Ktedonobacteraceae bacterium]